VAWSVSEAVDGTITATDPEAATRRSFDGVPAFPVDPRWLVAGRYIPYDEPRQVEVATARADLRQYVTAVGVVHVELGGTAYGLVATVAAGGRIDGPVVLSFHDETNGSETALPAHRAAGAVGRGAGFRRVRRRGAARAAVRLLVAAGGARVYRGLDIIIAKGNDPRLERAVRLRS
jgi:hypothetical protein